VPNLGEYVEVRSKGGCAVVRRAVVAVYNGHGSDLADSRARYGEMDGSGMCRITCIRRVARDGLAWVVDIGGLRGDKAELER
jgi:hypothetical protein